MTTIENWPTQIGAATIEEFPARPSTHAVTAELR